MEKCAAECSAWWQFNQMGMLMVLLFYVYFPQKKFTQFGKYSRSFWFYCGHTVWLLLLSMFLSRCLYHASSTAHCLYFDALIHNSSDLFPPSLCPCACTCECVCACLSTKVSAAGGAGNGCMYNASAVHFQFPIAHDAADSSSDRHTWCPCLPSSRPVDGE